MVVSSSLLFLFFHWTTKFANAKSKTSKDISDISSLLPFSRIYCLKPFNTLSLRVLVVDKSHFLVNVLSSSGVLKVFVTSFKTVGAAVNVESCRATVGAAVNVESSGVVGTS